MEYVQLELDSISEEKPCTDSDDSSAEDVEPDPEFVFQSIIGRNKYTPEIRKLYYSLLAEHVPVSKISNIIRDVLKCFHPSVDVDKLKLPQKTCASYMRKDELSTINDAYKAHIFYNTQAIYLNSDGTTKRQRKLGGTVANGIVVSVNELADGKAVSIVGDISKEFEKIRRVAEMLKLPNSNSFNWTLVKASTSDSASTQKCLNKLIDEKRQRDEEKFGPISCTTETLELIETFCAMHLGVNLRKVFLNGTVISDGQDERYHRVDTLVHEFCKLFGKTGGPEYACGVLSLPDFLQLQISTMEDSDCKLYYEACLNIRLHRQVGSRYFVSAANATKILFLKDAAIEFLKYTGKVTSGNKLEKDVIAKLNDHVELVHLQADSLMYYHVYGDLYMLSKSADLALSVLSMNQHYLELYEYLTEIETNPEIVFNSNYSVFHSEKRIYSSNPKLNHRLKSGKVYEKLFDMCSSADSLLCTLLVKGTSKMREKLSTYAKDQLPGGRYWDADEDVKRILHEIKPSNDACESVLGLNDYLTTAIPNMHQMSRSNLIQIKKNKTLKWLSSLPENKQSEIVDLAVKQRRLVNQENQEAEKERARQRQHKIFVENNKRIAEKRLRDEKEKLSESHLITTSDELKAELHAIDMENSKDTKKKKVALLKQQINIRKKVLSQPVHIGKGKERPVHDVIQELCDFIDQSTLPVECEGYIRNPLLLIGKRVNHRFIEDDSSKWYTGKIIKYSQQEKAHCILYDGESEHCFFNLTLDIILGDIIVHFFLSYLPHLSLLF